MEQNPTEMGNQSTGFPLFRQQFGALMTKNALLSWRNKPATLLQLTSSLFFLFLIFAVDEAVQSRYASTTNYKNVYVPQSTKFEGIPECEEGYFINTPCYDLLWSGNASRVVTAIVKNIMANNPGRRIPSEKDDILKWLTSTFFLWFLLAIYFDNVVPDVNGVRKSLFYFLEPSYWTGKDNNLVEGGSFCSCTGSIPQLPQSSSEDEDVMEEETLVNHQAVHNIVDPNVAVQIRGLVKTFPRTTKLVGCCKCKSLDPYHAVKGLWINLEKDKLFCLLGHNGAGKTTIINCLTGVTPITAGDAVIYGHSIRSATGKSHIQNFMGVCPQFDTLWDPLSSHEHLYLFGSIKGIPPAAIKDEAENLLSQVKLSDAANVRTGSCSGGMKRRLSVAIALIGNPKLIFLDEPTTGMDPITRRHVWDIIESAKSGRAIVLTTHSMEEADILSDRVAIMTRGKLRCLGTPIRLKSRFGTGYIVNISMHTTCLGSEQTQGWIEPLQTEGSGLHSGPVKRFFKDHLNVEPKEENKSYITFVIPREKEEQLKDFFAELQDKEKELGISDIQLSLTTLEEVFLNISKQAELETAAAE